MTKSHDTLMTVDDLIRILMLKKEENPNFGNYTFSIESNFSPSEFKVTGIKGTTFKVTEFKKGTKFRYWVFVGEKKIECECYNDMKKTALKEAQKVLKEANYPYRLLPVDIMSRVQCEYNDENNISDTFMEVNNNIRKRGFM